MQVKLVSYSMASKELFEDDSGSRTAQGLVAYCARVSNPANQLNHDTSEKLIR